MSHKIFSILIITLQLLSILQFFSLTHGQCNKITKCSECIQSSGCFWCAKEKITTPCLEISQKYLCESNAVDPSPKSTKLPKTPTSNTQMFPSEVKVENLRINTPFKTEIVYTQENYPVDIYFLLDISWSMEKTKMKLSELSNKLANEVGLITSDYRLGFGTFVDKPLYPFYKADEVQNEANKPYSFENDMKLEQDVEKFKNIVKNKNVIGNNDDPESGLDGLMQAMVCDEIGWRNNSHRLIIYSSDSTFHLAGDGRLAGIITPHDEKCHLSKGKYTHDAILDYPSINQINRIAKEKKINIIFAVTKNVVKLYEQLSERLSGMAVATILDEDSKDSFVKIVREEYKKIQSAVELRSSQLPKHVSVKFSTVCPENKTVSERCENVQVNTNITFDVEINVSSCDVKKKTFKVHPRSAGVSSTEIELNLACECDCETKTPVDVNSASCYKRGSLICGQCICNEGFLGNQCECEADAPDKIDEHKCIKNPKVENKTCSGVGHCKCGKCICNTDRQDPDKRIYGEFCECNNYSCTINSDNHEICSGKDHGDCDCGTCKCNSDWTGEACECSLGTKTCKANSDDEEICSGRGKCKCGNCVCESLDNFQYSGKFCERCPTCLGRCDEYKDCVICKIEGENCSDKRQQGSVELLEQDKFEKIEDINLLLSCEVDAYIIGCNYRFVYEEEEYEDTLKFGKEKIRFKIRAMSKKYCVYDDFFTLRNLIIAGSTFLAISIITLIIWKVATEINDRREYRRLLEGVRSMETWQNPLFKEKDPAHEAFLLQYSKNK